jgi:Putative translation initiation inhibitor, yjgF family
MADIQRHHTGARISRVVVHNGVAYLAGILALQKRGGTVEEQTRDILALIDRLLAEAGTDKSKLLTATIYLADIRTAEEMNAVWEEWLPEGCAPARTTIEGKPTDRAHAVKIAVTAAVA